MITALSRLGKEIGVTGDKWFPGPDNDCIHLHMRHVSGAGGWNFGSAPATAVTYRNAAPLFAQGESKHEQYIETDGSRDRRGRCHVVRRRLCQHGQWDTD